MNSTPYLASIRRTFFFRICCLSWLESRCGIGTPDELRSALSKLLSHTDLAAKRRDFEHLLFQSERSEQIMRFGAFVKVRLG